MQNPKLIPSPLAIEQASHRPIEIAEPSRPSRRRFIKVVLFALGMFARTLIARLWPRYGRRFDTLAKARLLRAFMEEMGGLWIKAGQIIALRRDIFSEQFCSEIARLQDRVRGFPFHYARKQIEDALGQPLDAVFSEFNEKPLAAASIGQVYSARLRSTGVDVVVKVRRPNVAESFAADFRFLYFFVTLLSWTNAAPHFRFEDMYWELHQAIMEELDYRQEAATLRRMKKNLRSQKIYVPKVFFSLSRESILVMERVRGVYMSEFIAMLVKQPDRVAEWMQENKINPKEAGERLLFSHYQQLFEDNLYHCDLHPGNILLMRRSRITLIDFGSVGTSCKSQLAKQLHMFRALAVNDYHKVADLFLIMAPALPDRDLTDVKEKVIRLYREYEPLAKIKSLPYHQKSIGNIVSKVMPVFAEAGVTASWDMLRSLRAQLTIDASLMFLLPQINYTKIIRTYLRKMRERMSKRMRSPAAIRAQAAKATEMADMPAQLAENAYFEGEYLRRRALKFKGYLSSVADLARTFFFVLSYFWLAGTLAIMAVGVYQTWFPDRLRAGSWLYTQLHRIPTLDPLIWLCGALVAFHASRELSKIAHIIEQPEPVRAGDDRR